MNKTQEALKMAIEQIKWAEHLHDWHDGLLDALKACKEALEQPAQEPVAKGFIRSLVSIDKNGIETWKEEPFYTSPPSWQGLSNDRIRDIGDNCLENNNGLFNWIDFARAIEQALKEKNT